MKTLIALFLLISFSLYADTDPKFIEQDLVDVDWTCLNRSDISHCSTDSYKVLQVHYSENSFCTYDLISRFGENEKSDCVVIMDIPEKCLKTSKNSDEVHI